MDTGDRQNSSTEQELLRLEERCRVLEERCQKLKAASRQLKRSCYRYWSLFNWSPVGFLALDDRLTIRESNMAAARFLGARRNALLGTSLDRHLSGEHRALLMKSFRNCVQSSHDEVEVQVALEENRVLFVQIRCEPYRYHGDPEQLYRVAMIDISKLKAAEATLQRLNRLYAMLTATNNAIIHAESREALFHEICRIAVEQGGFRKACIGLFDSDRSCVTPVVSAGVENLYSRDLCICFRDDLRGEGAVQASLREKGYYVSNDCLSDPDTAYLRGSGRQFGVRSVAVFVLTGAGREIGTFSIAASEVGFFDRQLIELLTQMAADISFSLENMELQERRREAEEALQRETLEKLRTMEELRSKEHLLMQQSRHAAMGELLGNIAHHWRQPLNIVALIIQELALQYDTSGLTRETLTAGTDKAMQVILQLSQTINDFSSFFKPDHTRSLFKVNDAVARTLALVEAGFQRLNLRVEVSALGEVFVNGYQNEFSQALLNIVLNARDAFVERRVAEPRLSIRIEKHGGAAVVTVADNAGGIDEAILPKVFDPYFSTKGPDRGIGVGLYMTKTIIESSMNGRVTVRNTAEGAEFTITVPG